MVFANGGRVDEIPPDPNNIAKYFPYFHNFELFPMASKQNVHETLRSSLKLDGAVVDQVKEVSKYLYDARFSLLSKTIEEFAAIKFEATSCERLSIALKRSVKAHKEDLLRLLNERAVIKFSLKTSMMLMFLLE